MSSASLYYSSVMDTKRARKWPKSSTSSTNVCLNYSCFLLCVVLIQCLANVDNTTTTLATPPLVNSRSETNSYLRIKSCSWNATEGWPPNASDKTLMLGYLMTRTGNFVDKLGRQISGIISYAVHHVNSNHLLPDNYTLQFKASEESLLHQKEIFVCVRGPRTALVCLWLR